VIQNMIGDFGVWKPEVPIVLDPLPEVILGQRCNHLIQGGSVTSKRNTHVKACAGFSWDSQTCRISSRSPGGASIHGRMNVQKQMVEFLIWFPALAEMKYTCTTAEHVHVLLRISIINIRRQKSKSNRWGGDISCMYIELALQNGEVTLDNHEAWN